MQLKEEHNQNNKPKCLVYARVSTSDQIDNLSIETQQIKALEKIQELGGYLAEDCYIDNGISGTTLNRPSLQSLLVRCSKKDIRYLVVQDISRLSRNTVEYCLLTSELEKSGVEIIPLSGIMINNDPISRTMNEMMAVMNSFFPRMTSYKVKQTASEKFKAGYYPSWAPIGYKNTPNEHSVGSYDKRIIVPDLDVAPFITQVFKMYATRNYSIYDITEHLRKNGIIGRKGKPLQYSVVHTILRNPFHWGFMKFGSLEGMGKHQPIIDKQTFDMVQKILDEKGKYSIRHRKHNFLLRGVVFCKDCGKRYVAEYHYDSKYKSEGGKVGMYHCSQTGKRGKCPSRSLSMKNLEDQVWQEVGKLEFKPEFIEAVKKNINKVYEDSINQIKQTNKSIYNRRDAVEMKRERLEQGMMNGNIVGDAFKRMNATLDKETLEIQKELAEVDKIRTLDTSVIDDVLSLTNNIVKTYENADTDHKRAYLHFFFQKIWVKDRKIAGVEYTPAIQVLKESNSVILSSDWLPIVNDVGTDF